jgi:hypothetical protein
MVGNRDVIIAGLVPPSFLFGTMAAGTSWRAGRRAWTVVAVMLIVTAMILAQ